MEVTEPARWLPVAGYEGLYEVSDQGRVWSVPREDRMGRPKGGLFITPKPKPEDGRLQVALYRDGAVRQTTVHRIMAEAFIGPPPTDHAVVRHLNDIPVDNRLENLAWGTYSDNNRDMVRNGTHHYSSRSACKRGHPFTGANIRPRGDGSGRRSCVACHRAAVSRGHLPGVGFDMQRLSDAHYRVIESGEKYLSREEKMSCAITQETT